MAVLPAVIGLMPMPGGAVFSAPLVNSCDPYSELTPSIKTRINYWFRHVWEYWWPLYPGVLLAIDISGLQISHFMALMFPVTIFSVAGAWFFLLRKTGNNAKPDRTAEASSPAGPGFIYLVSPIIMIVGIYALLSILFPALLSFSRYLPITIGIVSSVIYLQIIRPLPASTWKRLIFSRKAVNMALLVALIRIYGAFIEGQLPDGTLLMDLIRSDLATAGFSPYILIMLIPFLCGVSTGIAIGTVGASFPIVMSLLGPEPGFALVASTTVLAYSFGHVGQLMSPVHVCLLVSNEYFKVSLTKSLIGIVKPALVVLAAGLLLSRLYLLIL
jgi:integral membrane protein (TIGR00529 family)